MQLIQPSPRDISRVEASRRFGRYMSEEEHGCRDLSVSGDELMTLRQRREMLRNMDIEQAKDMITFHKGLDIFQGVALARKEGRLIVPNDIHDRILTETNDRTFFDNNYPVWTGTVVVYEAPDNPFGDRMVYEWISKSGEPNDVRFDIPVRFRGRANCALVIEHPDFDFIRVGNRSFELKADEENIQLIERFPNRTDMWYGFDNRFRITVGDEKPDNGSTRFLYRNMFNYLGLVGRDYGGNGLDNSRRDVNLYGRPSHGVGVAVF